MKPIIFCIFTVISAALFPSFAMAGEGCAEKGYHNKNMSAKTSEEFKKHHGWMKSKDHHMGSDKVVIETDKADQKAEEQDFSEDDA